MEILSLQHKKANKTLTMKQLTTIMKRTMGRLMVVVAALVAASCTGDKFHVEGSITDAKDSTLYFENLSLEGVVTLDSVRLSADGKFSFSGERPEAPEFYRLRMGGQAISLSIDSTETVSIHASYPTMASEYEVEGSEECLKIKQLSLMQQELTRKAIALQNDHSIGPDEARDSILGLIANCKKTLTAEYIYKQPVAPSAYYALFLTVGRYLIFDPRTSADDIRAFAAVATSWDTYHPGSLRGQNLHNIALEGMKNARIAAAENEPMAIDESKIVTSGLIDITLTDNKGRERSLSDLKGRVVMLDFHVFAAKQSAARILMLRELYNKYREQGFEIYQVSLDSDEHFWKQQTAALPWISVRDADGLGSRKAAAYNVQDRKSVV